MNFTAPKIISPFYCYKRVPRKFKKKWKHIFDDPYLDINQKCWYILEFTNPQYKQFIINQIIEHEKSRMAC
jgi:hypothetical protein